MPAPLPNRVDPFGDLFATPERGHVGGNRGGRFQPADGTLGPRRWSNRHWIACRLAFKGRRRDVRGPGFTWLFFLDEMTALSAGHRPCAECRRADFLRFRDTVGARSADEIDMMLDGERRDGRAKRIHRLVADSLPEGAVIARGNEALGLVEGVWRRWSTTGWGEVVTGVTGVVDVLTPPTSLRALARGYRPEVVEVGAVPFVAPVSPADRGMK
jgi:hypothetical protein